MDKIRAAESILSQVYPRDRATSIAGDFNENSRHFWIDVITTSLTALRHDITEHPISLITLAARGILRSAAASLSALFLLVFATLPWDATFAVFSVLKTTPPAWLREISIVCNALAIIAAQFLCQFQVGRSVAQRAPGREIAIAIAVCVPSLMFRQIAVIVLNPFLLFFTFAIDQHVVQSDSVALPRILYFTAVCAGAVSVRLKAPRAAA